jgi:RHS repeat-associated protein
VRAKVTAINGSAVTTQQATELDLETTGDNLYSEKMAYAQTSSQAISQASTQSMTIEGEITLTWTGAANAIPTGSRLGVTINAGQAPCVVGVGGGAVAGAGTGTTTPATAQNYYIHADHLGSPRTITRSSDNVKVWEWKNDDAFGNNAADENPNGANNVNGAAAAFTYNLRFPGQYFDKETNTNYNYFRDYDPTTGRYVQSDPIGLKGGINTFGYANANPISYTDPTGESPSGAGGGAIITGGLFCVRYPRICKEIFDCLRNPAACQKRFCKLGHALYKPLCNVPGCQDCEGCATTMFKAAAAEGCVFLRQATRLICHKNDPSQSGVNHELEIQNAQAKFQRCMSLLASNCSGGVQ